MIDWQATGIYIAYPTTEVFKLTYPGHRTQVNHKHTKVGIARRSFESRARDYRQTFHGEVEFIPLAVVQRDALSAIEVHFLAELSVSHRTVGFAKEWFATDDRLSIVRLVSNVALKFAEIALDLEYFDTRQAACMSVGEVQMSLQEARIVLEALANGVDPENGQPVSKESCVHRPRVIRALFLASKLLAEAELRGKSTISPLAKAGNPWSAAEDQQLLAEHDRGATTAMLAQSYERTVGAITSRLIKLGRLNI